MKDISYVINHGKSGVKLLQGRQLVISEDVRSLRATGRLTTPPYSICIILCDPDYNPLEGTLYLRYLEGETWHDVEGMELDLGNWLFREVPAGKEYYRVEGEAEGWEDPKKPENQFMTEDELKQKHWHIMEVPPPTTVTFYPDRDPEVTCCDGQTESDCGYYGKPWAEAHVYPANNAGATGATFGVRVQAGSNTDMWRYFNRCQFLFDTSVIPPGATIISAKFRVFGDWKQSNPYWPDWAVALVPSDPLSNIDIVLADHLRLGTTLLSNTFITQEEWKVGDWNEFPLNAAGLARITKGGITKFGLREKTYDAANKAPPWGRNYRNTVRGHSADNASGNRPELVVTYQP